MSVINTLEKLDYFVKRTNEWKQKASVLAMEKQKDDQEFSDWIGQELKLEGEFSLAEILKAALEKNIEKSSLIKIV